MTVPPPVPDSTRFKLPHYLIRRKVLTMIGAKFHVFSDDGSLVLFSKMKGFKLKEDIRLYTDESMTTELLTIQARQIIDFSAAYDVFDTPSGTKVGALRRRGFKSILRDEWIILDPEDREIGKIVEDSMVLALVRRLLSGLVPQAYHVHVGDAAVATMKQNFNPFVMKLRVDFSADADQRLDRRLGLAAGVLLCAIERRQN